MNDRLALEDRRPRRCPSGPATLGPEGELAFSPLVSSQIQWRVRLAYLQHAIRAKCQDRVGLPLDRALFDLWIGQKAGSRSIESFGLPRRSVEHALGDEALTLHINPRQLVRLAVRMPAAGERRPSSLFFIWDGNWDERREDLRVGTRYQFISELDEHRADLTQTKSYRSLVARIAEGKPWHSHQEGILLDTPAKVLHYLQVYLGFLDSMATDGYVPSRCRDEIGVAISREGRILKINRGLHRLAMAQRLGLASIPVRVRCVHRLWWKQVTGDARGPEALERLRRALRQCVPEHEPGRLDAETLPPFPEDFWPAPRAVPSLPV